MSPLDGREFSRIWSNDTLLVHDKLAANLGRFAGLLKPGSRVLEIGCSGGFCFDWLAMRVAGLRYVGVDTEPLAIDRARNAHAGTEAVFEVGDIYDLAPTVEKHGPFDAALCLRTVFHVPWLEKCLAQLAIAAPISLVGLRVGERDICRQRINDVSGEANVVRVYSWETVESSLPRGNRHALYPDRPYHSLVLYDDKGQA